MQNGADGTDNAADDVVHIWVLVQDLINSVTASRTAVSNIARTRAFADEPECAKCKRTGNSALPPSGNEV